MYDIYLTQMKNRITEYQFGHGREFRSSGTDDPTRVLSFWLLWSLSLLMFAEKFLSR